MMAPNDRHSVITWLILAMVCSPGCIRQAGSPGPGKTTELPPVEIKEFEGKTLSSRNDFPENSIKGPQHINRGGYRLKLTGLVKTPVTLEYDSIINGFTHYKKVVTLNCVEGWDMTVLWEGVLVKDLLRKAEPSPKAITIIFHCRDGYMTSFPLDYVLSNDIMLAYNMNGLPLLPERGFPFQLVAESKWGYKWAKWVTEIELSDNAGYRGYWESRGYSNSGDLDKSFREH